jgi:hypothetical protein
MKMNSQLGPPAAAPHHPRNSHRHLLYSSECRENSLGNYSPMAAHYQSKKHATYSSAALWDVPPCGLAYIYRHFGEKYCLLPQIPTACHATNRNKSGADMPFQYVGKLADHMTPSPGGLSVYSHDPAPHAKYIGTLSAA